MDAIPLIRTRYLQAFAAAADQTGLRPLRLLEDLGIPEWVTENAESLHPATQLFSFAEQAAKVSGRADLGLVAGRTKLEEHGTFGARVVQSETLHQALETFCSAAMKEYSRADFWVETRGKTTWFCREKIDGSAGERQQMELYLLELMLQTVRTVAGPRWRPRELRLQSENERELGNVDTLSQHNLRFGSPILAIPIPRKLMSRSLPPLLRNPSTISRVSPAETMEEPPIEFVDSLRQILGGYLSNGYPRIETIAEAAGTSVRTLQRRLAVEGLNYSKLLDEVRSRKALPLLEDPKTPIAAIAYELGYSHPAHFTRAFRRWAGVSPSEYRVDLLAR